MFNVVFLEFLNFLNFNFKYSALLLLDLKLSG
jgi:hypothetical protein